MIQANELRITNLVEYSGIPWKVTGIISPSPVKEKRFSYKYIVELFDGAGITNAPVDECKGIPITEGWLKRFGFIIEYTNGGFLLWQKESFKLVDRRLPHPQYHSPAAVVVYIHQLQNLFFALTGEELKL